MAKYAHPDVLDGGLLAIKNGCNKMVLLSAYTDVYATAVSTTLAEAAMTSGDFVITGTTTRVLTTATGKSDAAANATGGSATNHIAFLDTTNSKVLWVTPESSGQAIVSTSNAVNFPSVTYTAYQPA